MSLLLAIPAMMAMAAGEPATAKPYPLTAAPAAPAPSTVELRAGDLRVRQLWTTDEARFQRELTATSPPRLTNDTTAQRNQRIYLRLLYSGCKADGAGNCRLTGRFEIRDPAGKLYGRHENIDLWPGKTAPPPNSIAISPTKLGLRIEPGEKLGVYTVRLTVTDVNAGVSANGVTTVTVVEAPQ